MVDPLEEVAWPGDETWPFLCSQDYFKISSVALFEYGQIQSGTGEPKRFASEDLSHRLPSGEAIE
jgi:hypothetical protein